MIILDTIWFTTHLGETIGIVLGRDAVTQQTKAYIGMGGGLNEAHDIAHISQHGAKFLPVQAIHLKQHLCQK